MRKTTLGVALLAAATMGGASVQAAVHYNGEGVCNADQCGENHGSSGIRIGDNGQSGQSGYCAGLQHGYSGYGGNTPYQGYQSYRGDRWSSQYTCTTQNSGSCFGACGPGCSYNCD